MKRSILYYLPAQLLLWILPAQADLGYSDQPLYLSQGVQPNVALVIDNSTSMGWTANMGGTGSFTSACNGVTLTHPLTRITAAKEAACQMVQDNAGSMRIALYSFSSADGTLLSDFGSTVPALMTSINGISPNASSSPWAQVHRGVSAKYFGSSSPIQYRCQKNHVLFIVDGEPTFGSDASSSITLPTLSPQQPSPWFGSTASTGSTTGSPNWDGYPDPQRFWTDYQGGSYDYYSWLDDMAQLAYDVDIKGSASPGLTPSQCGGFSSPMGMDCSGKSWDASDHPRQNVITHMMGLGYVAENELLRDTPLVNQVALLPTDVNVASDMITVPAHGLHNGDYVHYYTRYESNDYNTDAVADTGADTLSGDTTQMVAGNLLAYTNGGGATLQYQAITTPAVPPASCGAIGGLTSGSSYYVSEVNSSIFSLSTTSANAYQGGIINLTTTGDANTIHSFNRTAATVGFQSTTGTVPVNINTNIEKITVTGHGLATGELVTYTCTGTSCAIAPLINGNTYYVAYRSATEFRLATSSSQAAICAGAADGSATVGTTCINLTSRGATGTAQTFTKVVAPPNELTITATGTGTVPVSTGTDRVTSTAHGFNTGDRVTYTCSDFAGTPAIYTSYDLPAAVYATNVVPGNPGTFQLSLTAGGPALDISNAGNAAQTFAWTANNPQTLIGGLYAYETDQSVTQANPDYATHTAARGKYFVNVVDNNTIQLHECGDSRVVDTDPGAAVYNVTQYCFDGKLAPVDLTTTGYGTLSTGPGQSHSAKSTAELNTMLKEFFNNIRQDNLRTETGMMGSAISANTTTEWSANTRLHQTVFNPLDWSGDIRGYQADYNGGIYPVPEWEASTKLPAHGSRNIITRNNTNGGFDFTAANWGKLTAAQQTALSNAGLSTVGQQVMNWLRGEDVAGYRMRTDSKLGDILNSSPVYVGGPDKTYNNVDYGLPSSNPGKPTYNAFKATARNPMIYVGANDGMVHGFDASFIDSNQGVEKIAFIPEAVYMDWNDQDNDGIKDAAEAPINKFYALGQEYYGQVAAQPHHYFVDGTPVTGDAFFATSKAGLSPNSWHTVLVGGLGKGGRGVYALDITDDTFNQDDVLWEFNDNNSGDMGYSYGQPTIALLDDGRWVAIFGNGYDSNSDRARIFVVNLETGALIQQFDLGTDPNNGVASVSVLTSHTVYDGVTAQAVYAGDLRGNVWKVDLTGAAAFTAALARTVSTPFFVAQDSSGNRQAITSAITLNRYPSVQNQGVMLFFGTGSYFTFADQSYTGTPLYDAMYGIWDNQEGWYAENVDISQLVEQQMGTIALDPDGDGIFEGYRTATSYSVDYGYQRGWYMKLAVTSPVNDFKGERVVFAPVTTASGSFVLFTTVIPAAADPCASGGSSYFYTLDVLTGGAKPDAVFDLNKNGETLDDMPEVTGIRGEGVLSKLVAIHDGSDQPIKACVTSSNGLTSCENLFLTFPDTDGDGLNDYVDTDDDNDGVSDRNELRRGSDPLLVDTDGDAVDDYNDAFPADNTEWTDTDGDNIGNNSDWDDDGDYLDDVMEFQIGTDPLLTDTDGDMLDDGTEHNAMGTDPLLADTDGDGLDDWTEYYSMGTDPLLVDTDGDGANDSADLFPLDSAELLDTDGDGIGNNADGDDDNDGVPDVVDAAPLDAGDTSEITLPLDGTYKGGMLGGQRLGQ